MSTIIHNVDYLMNFGALTFVLAVRVLIALAFAILLHLKLCIPAKY